jgi:hypothetical protein
MDTEHTDGWAVPVYHAVASPRVLLICGVPQTFFIANILAGVLVVMTGNLLYGALWWRVAVGTLVLHGLTMLGTAYEVQWLDMSWRYLRYVSIYEG